MPLWKTKKFRAFGDLYLEVEGDVNLINHSTYSKLKPQGASRIEREKSLARIYSALSRPLSSSGNKNNTEILWHLDVGTTLDLIDDITGFTKSDPASQDITSLKLNFLHHLLSVMMQIRFGDFNYSHDTSHRSKELHKGFYGSGPYSRRTKELVLLTKSSKIRDARDLYYLVNPAAITIPHHWQKLFPEILEGPVLGIYDEDGMKFISLNAPLPKGRIIQLFLPEDQPRDLNSVLNALLSCIGLYNILPGIVFSLLTFVLYLNKSTLDITSQISFNSVG